MRARFATSGTLILAISAAAAISIFLTTDAMYFSDSNSYLIYSFALSHFRVEPGVVYRQVGYPLLIIPNPIDRFCSFAAHSVLGSGFAGPSTGSSGNPVLGPGFRGDERSLN